MTTKSTGGGDPKGTSESECRRSGGLRGVGCFNISPPQLPLNSFPEKASDLETVALSCY